MKKSVLILCRFIIVLGALNLGASFVHNQQLGGDALNGHQKNGHFYVSEHGEENEVSEQQWQLSRWHTLSLIVTHPLLMGALFLLNFKHEFPKEMFRGDAEAREKTVERIRSSGPPIMQLQRFQLALSCCKPRRNECLLNGFARADCGRVRKRRHATMIFPRIAGVYLCEVLLCPALFELDGRFVSQSRMQALPVVKEFDVIEQRTQSIGACFGNTIAEVIEAFGFDRRPKRLR